MALISIAASGNSNVAAAAVIHLSLNSDSLPAQPVGTTTHWMAVAKSDRPDLEYQFSISPLNGPTLIVRSFHASNSFEWTPMVEGTYRVIAKVRDGDGNTGMIRIDYAATSLLTAPDAGNVAATGHPLVAIYSAPACSTGSMRVMFYPAAASASKQFTAYQKCVENQSLNFWIAGMQPDTDYVMRQQLAAPDQPVETGPEIAYHSGAIPDTVTLPAASIVDPPDAQTDGSESLLLTSYLALLRGQLAIPVATNSTGGIVWYYDQPDKPLRYLLRPLPGGDMFVLPQDPALLREIDLAGNTVRETNTGWISEQLQARFGMPAITSFHHDAIRLPNGYIAAIASVDQIFDGIQGSSGPVDVVGDIIVVMDRNFKVTWAWNSFDKMDVSRGALLAEKCAAGNPGCPPIPQAATIQQKAANDWTHSNAIAYLPDGNLLLSMRHQDWVIKIDYRNGAGTGNVLWRLGKDGDFTMQSSDAYPWFSHQHSVVLDGATVWLFDNGNTRRSVDATANSRGQVLEIDESAMTAAVMLNADLGNYSAALGSAERLNNGNYHFMAGYLANGHSQSIEIVPDPMPAGTMTFLQDAANPAYRSFRMKNLSTP